MRISITLWAGSLVPTDGEYDLDRLADDFAEIVRNVVAARFPEARVSVTVEDGEGLEPAVRVLPMGSGAENVEMVAREIVSTEWETFDFDAYLAEG